MDTSQRPEFDTDSIEGVVTKVPETEGFVMNQTMFRIRDPDRSLAFYREVLGMTLLRRLDFPEMQFSLYFLGYVRDANGPVPTDSWERTAYTFRQQALIELTHNWGTETDSDFTGYHNGNDTPQGFGHIGLAVPDVDAACRRFDSFGISFVKRPDEGKMKGLAFIRDPDGYWIEILEASSLADLAAGMADTP